MWRKEKRSSSDEDAHVELQRVGQGRYLLGKMTAVCPLWTVRWPSQGQTYNPGKRTLSIAMLGASIRHKSSSIDHRRLSAGVTMIRRIRKVNEIGTIATRTSMGISPRNCKRRHHIGTVNVHNFAIVERRESYKERVAQRVNEAETQRVIHEPNP